MNESTQAGIDILFQPYTIAPDLTLENRIVMAPMTRSLAGPGHVPTDDMVAYYRKRAETGLIITEATVIRPDGHGYPDTPGIYTDEQVAGWKKVTSAVHDAGGKIFLQLWHVGRVSHPTFTGGVQPVAPSAVALEGSVPRARDLEYETPRPLEPDEVVQVIEDYASGTRRAMEAGFDGVEIHGANGYLIDQFLHWHTNHRDDEWGGSSENMARIAIATVDRCMEEAGELRVGIRLSPGAYFNQTGDPRDAAVFEHLLDELSKRKLAYTHVGIFSDRMTFEELGGLSASAFMREHYSGTLIGCGSYKPQSGADAIEEGQFDLLALGRPLIANPDLVRKLKNGEDLITYDESMLASLD